MMSSKAKGRCNICNVSKDPSCYTLGFQACVVCFNKIRAYIELTSERIKELATTRYQKQKEEDIARATKYKEENRGYLREKIKLSCMSEASDEA